MNSFASPEPKEFLKLSDKLRDDDLVDVGVVLDDREGGKALVKIVDREVLIKQREEKRQVIVLPPKPSSRSYALTISFIKRELQKQKEKEEKARIAAQKRADKLAKGATPPAEFFTDEAGRKEFSEWDEQVCIMKAALCVCFGTKEVLDFAGHSHEGCSR